MNYYPIFRWIQVSRSTSLFSFYSLRIICMILPQFIYRFRFGIAVAIVVSMPFIPSMTFIANQSNANTVYAQEPLVIFRTDAETFYLNAINKLRADNGQSSLVIDSRLSDSAAKKTADMISQNYWGHYAPNGVSFADYVWEASPAANRSGENLVRCINDRQMAFEALVASRAHYQVMMGNYTNMGVYEVVIPGTNCTLTTTHFSYNK